MSVKRKDHTKDGVCEISTPLPSESYVAVADYIKQSTDELTLKEGDSLEVFIRDDSGWWLVCKEQLFGWVPYSYLEKVDGREDEPANTVINGKAERYVAVTEYTPEETDEVCLEKGQVVEVIEKHMDGWWRVRYTQQEGMAPAVNLAKADSRKARRALEKATIPNEADNDLDLDLFEKPKDDSDSDDDDFVDTLDIIAMREMVQASVRQGHATSSEGQSQLPRRWPSKKRAMLPPPRKGSLIKRSSTGQKTFSTPERPSIVSLEDNTPIQEESSSIAGGGSPPGSDEDPDEDPSSSRDDDLYENIVVGCCPVDAHMDESDNHDYYNVSPFNRKQSTKGRPLYESRSAFKAGDAGETDLYEGESVSVLEKTGTGWWLVQSCTGVGWVPSHFLRIPPNSPAKGPTAADVPGDVFEDTAAQRYMPKLPPNTKENQREQGHVAFRYLQNAHGFSENGITKSQGVEEVTPEVHPASAVNAAPPPPPRPTTAQKPAVPTKSPTASSKNSTSKPTSATKTGPTNSQSLTVSDSNGSNPSTGSPNFGVQLKPPVIAKKPTISTAVPPREFPNKQHLKSINDKDSNIEELQTGRSVKDLKAMFNKSQH